MSTLTIEETNDLAAVVEGNEDGEAIMALLLAEHCYAASQEGAHVCHGRLWQCERCHRWNCCSIGSASDDLCDDCWYGVTELGWEKE